MIRQRRHPDATQSTTRLEAYTDGVFAIAATLLVLNLTTHPLGEISSDADLWSALGAMWPLLENFLISFALLSLLWILHVRQFEHVARVDAIMLWLNNGRLLFIVLVPFVTGITAAHADLLAGRILMPITFFMAVLTSWLQWLWAARKRDVMLPDLADTEVRRGARATLSAVIIATVVVALSPLIGTLGFALFLLDGWLTRLLGGSNKYQSGIVERSWTRICLQLLFSGCPERHIGVWRSLVARFVRDEEVAGSNPVTPTGEKSRCLGFLLRATALSHAARGSFGRVE